MTTATDHSITLQGSAAIIHEYLKYSINSIIFQRGIYPSCDFTPEEYNGIPMMVSRDARIITYIDTMTTRVQDLIMKKMISKITVCIITVEKKEIVERWDFNITPQYDDDGDAGEEKTPSSTKSLAKIQKEIRDVMRQIIATISFLPCLEERCTFDIMLHTATDIFIQMPVLIRDFREEEYETIEIENAQTVELKPFSTGVNKVETKVVYRTFDS